MVTADRFSLQRVLDNRCHQWQPGEGESSFLLKDFRPIVFQGIKVPGCSGKEALEILIIFVEAFAIASREFLM
ncbi:MAG: hypothetical protein OZ917_10060 [Candidatus Brocadiaceae bacterium]|nr:hypothetical protein [Candidatus Brocadiaceae bacterium]